MYHLFVSTMTCCIAAACVNEEWDGGGGGGGVIVGRCLRCFVVSRPRDCSRFGVVMQNDIIILTIVLALLTSCGHVIGEIVTQ